MLEVKPLRVLRYSDKAGSMRDIIAPPYDVIDDDERARLADRSPHNAVHLILPAGDGQKAYDDAATRLAAWQESGVLLREQPALWRYRQTFEYQGRKWTRRSLFCGVGVRPYEDRVVLPHERTHKGPKEDRFRLKMATKTHLSAVFALFDDAQGAVADTLGGASCEVAFDVETPDGQGHELARIPADAAAKLTAAFSGGQLLIADGHHRYETMLRLSREVGSEESKIGFLCVSLLQDEGLIVGPTHRLLHSTNFDLTRFLDRCRQKFDVEPHQGLDATGLYALIQDRRAAAPAFALATPGRHLIYLLSLKPEAQLGDLAPDLRRIETAVLEQTLKELGPSGASISYNHDGADTLSVVSKGEVAAAFIVPPAEVKEVIAVAQAGHSMPQKSTFFFPKIPAGLLFHPFA